MTQKGSSSLLVLVALLAVVAVAVFFMVSKNQKSTDTIQTAESAPVTTFEKMDEPENTPAEINNESVDDMDKIFIEIEKSAPQDDLSDINL